jgi:DNA-binding transcriptional MocR family regulator
MRLNFAAQSEEEIEQGIRRLGKAIKRMKGGEEREENRE